MKKTTIWCLVVMTMSSCGSEEAGTKTEETIEAEPAAKGGEEKWGLSFAKRQEIWLTLSKADLDSMAVINKKYDGYAAGASEEIIRKNVAAREEANKQNAAIICKMFSITNETLMHIQEEAILDGW